MKPEIETALAKIALEKCSNGYTGKTGGESLARLKVWETLGVSEKEVLRTLEKWEGRDWWECGIGTLYGWFTPKGLKALFNIDAGDQWCVVCQKTWPACGHDK